MSPSQKPTFAASPNPSKEGTPEWFYDEIMRHIEPDLLTNVIPTHAEKYSKQSPEECAARLRAYGRAFEVFDKASADVAGEYRAGIVKIRESAKSKAKIEDRKEKEKTEEELKTIEREIEEEGKK